MQKIAIFENWECNFISRFWRKCKKSWKIAKKQRFCDFFAQKCSKSQFFALKNQKIALFITIFHAFRDFYIEIYAKSVICDYLKMQF